MEIKIVIADDHPMFRSGVRMAVESDKELIVLGEASDGKEALQLILSKKPDIAVLDINMPYLTGLQIAKELRNRETGVYVIFLTMFDDDDIFNEAMELDVKGYILKDSAALDIVSAIHKVHDGYNFISHSLISNLLKPKKIKPLPPVGLKSLSEKEVILLKLIADYKSTKEIAKELYLSHRTVDNYRSRISEKLNLSGSYSLLKFAVRNKNLL